MSSAPRGFGLLARLFALLILTVSALPAAASAATAARQVDPGEAEIGAVAAVGLDNNGDGWAWAYPKPQTFATTYLVRIKDGKWSIAADSTSNPDLLKPEVQIDHIALSGDGSDGWAIGGEPDADPELPVFWRLDNGAWRAARNNLPAGSRLVDLTLSGDARSGWITLFDFADGEWKLLRLQNGAWDFAPGPADGFIIDIGSSPDGNTVWGFGSNNQGVPTAFRFQNGAWNPVAVPVDAADVSQRVVVDNGGNAWVLLATDQEVDSEKVSGSVVIRSKLLRLVPGKQPVYAKLPLNSPRPTTKDDIPFNLHDIVLDGNGRGWASGEYFLGSVDQPSAIEDRYQSVLLRIEGDDVTLPAPLSTGLDPKRNFNPIALALSPDGGHTWAGGRDGVGFGHLYQLQEPWPHSKPAAADPLQGAALCFGPTDFCLRGIFATYWQQHGGLTLFGYPITPEVQEKIGDKSYVVQYTQRARLEWHPEFAGTANEVLLGLLGNTLVNDRLNEDPFKPAQKVTSFDVRWFPETQHNVSVPILPYWQQNGDIPVFGYPRSEAFEEVNQADGKTYLVQYFERNRIEYHPEFRGTNSEFLLGLLGVEQFKKTYGYTP